MDIDIDVPPGFSPDQLFDNYIVFASRVDNKDKNLTKHPTGVYFQKIPVDVVTNLSAIPYKRAEDLGYIKIDFITLSILQYFNNKKEIRDLLKKEPDWSLLEDKNIVSQLFHLHNYYELVNLIKPKSIEELADVLALIRPGKQHLIKVYLKNRDLARKELYSEKDKSKGQFKKSHAIAYAHVIVLQLHLLKNNSVVEF